MHMEVTTNNVSIGNACKNYSSAITLLDIGIADKVKLTKP